MCDSLHWDFVQWVGTLERPKSFKWVWWFPELVTGGREGPWNLLYTMGSLGPSRVSLVYFCCCFCYFNTQLNMYYLPSVCCDKNECEGPYPLPVIAMIDGNELLTYYWMIGAITIITAAASTLESVNQLLLPVMMLNTPFICLQCYG